MMGKLKDIQAKMKAAQDTLTAIKTTGESGGGMVKATVDGKKNLIALEIDESLIKVEDKLLMTQLLISAINKALQEVEPLAQEHIRKQTEGLIPNIPGFDLSKLTGQ